MDGFVAGLDAYLHGSVLLAFLAVYVGGVLVSFTPCIYPVIPITVAYIGSQSRGSRARGFMLSIFYVFGSSITYTILGMVAALSGSLFGQVQTNPWTYFIVANLCIFMGLAMLDVIHLSLPGFSMQSPSTRDRNGIIGSLLVGVGAGLALGPCTTPVLAVLLGYVASTQNVIYGASLMFVFAFGMGTLMIILGTFTGLLTSIPRAGVWMARIQKGFGWAMLAMGEYFLVNAGRFMV
ncbi:MAG: cytochrome c biogenesis protein CcdA [Thermodesulfobacteriota bacterium]|nr:cytochrome c biogenesis protein CcdA [Thermodesulfobacteriota bacterium]